MSSAGDHGFARSLVDDDDDWDGIEDQQKIVDAIKHLTMSTAERRQLLVKISDRKLIYSLKAEEQLERKRELCKRRQIRYRQNQRLHRE